jgi:hypothetical protein
LAEAGLLRPAVFVSEGDLVGHVRLFRC